MYATSCVLSTGPWQALLETAGWLSSMQAGGDRTNYERLYQRLEKLETAVRSQQNTNLLSRLKAIREGCKQAEENAKGFATFKKLCGYFTIQFVLRASLSLPISLDAKAQPLLNLGPEIGDPTPEVTAMKQTTILSAQPHLEGCVSRMEVGSFVCILFTQAHAVTTQVISSLEKYVNPEALQGLSPRDHCCH
jgi:hypothetical protein